MLIVYKCIRCKQWIKEQCYQGVKPGKKHGYMCRECVFQIVGEFLGIPSVKEGDSDGRIRKHDVSGLP
jgi:DNA-directed RNA polymerase subunit RPC12/RpoP